MAATASLLLIACQAQAGSQVEDAGSEAPVADKAQTVSVGYKLQQEFPLTIQVTSTSLKHTGYLQKDFTCEGPNLSPQLTFLSIPSETQSLAVVVDDIDAEEGIFAHWLMWGIPADVIDLEGGVSSSGNLPVGAVEGTNGFGTTGWKGPCPPPRVINNTHSNKQWASGVNTGIISHVYVVNVYALDADISAPAGATREEVLRQVEGHVLAGGSLSTKYLSSITIRK